MALASSFLMLVSFKNLLQINLEAFGKTFYLTVQKVIKTKSDFQTKAAKFFHSQLISQAAPQYGQNDSKWTKCRKDPCTNEAPE